MRKGRGAPSLQNVNKKETSCEDMWMFMQKNTSTVMQSIMLLIHFKHLS